jgi:hypothetical protein
VTTPAATVTATEPTPPTTATAESPQAALTQGQAKDAARAGASRAVARFGITIPAGDWDARCTAVGGAARAAVWRCQVTANSGQCAGPLTAYASAPGEAAIRDEQIACGE